MGRKLDQTLAVLNGLVGDYLSRTDNGLATPMACWRGGRCVGLDAAGLAAAYPDAGPRVVVLVHGLMNTEACWRFAASDDDYGSLLARDLGFTPVYVRYNSGLPIADNGAALARLLDQLVRAYPVPIEELLLVGYSMGGLLLRSACHVAAREQLAWLPLVRRAIYVGTPHLGAPAERVGRVAAGVLRAIRDPYTRLVADIGDLRSAGMKDLGHADLRHEDRVPRSLRVLREPGHPLPLLPSIAHHLIAGTIAVDPRLGMLFGDAMVSVVSATFDAAAETARELVPGHRIKILRGIGHVALSRHADVYAQIKAWCEA
jgi:pimeloyl-ACP methyl ester carboxylesterase